MRLPNLFEVDARWSQRLRVAERPGPLRAAAGFLAHSGDSWFWLLALVIVWWRGDIYWRTWALRLFVAIAVTAVIVFALKLGVRRKRPAGEWGTIYRITDPHSFPSGHAARAVMLMILIAAWGPAWAVPIVVLWAPLVALARVAMGVHFLSDVVAGAALGSLTGAAALLIAAG